MIEGDVDTMVTEKSQTAPALASMVSGSYFSMLGARAELGRVLALADEQVATLGLDPPRPAYVVFLAPGGPHALVIRIFLSRGLDRLPSLLANESHRYQNH